MIDHEMEGHGAALATKRADSAPWVALIFPAMIQRMRLRNEGGLRSTGVASSTFAPNQNFQTSGVTNVVSSQAMTAIPLPIER
jgi:hypothetical protein